MDWELRQRIAWARARMCDELQAPLRIAALAREARVSEQHFVRLFRATYGVTPQHYLASQRMARAKLLLTRDVSVTEVCFSVGYSSLGTFSRRFALETARSPRAFQRHMRGFGAVPERLVALYVPFCFMARHMELRDVRLGEVLAAAPALELPCAGSTPSVKETA